MTFVTLVIGIFVGKVTFVYLFVGVVVGKVTLVLFLPAKVTKVQRPCFYP